MNRRMECRRPEHRRKVMAKPENIALQFLKKQSPYNAGEIAGFPERVAQQFLRAGIAKLAPSPAEVEEQAAGDVEHWKKKFRDLGAAYTQERDRFLARLKSVEKERDDLKQLVEPLELERDKLLRQVNELEGLLAELRAQTTAKPEGEAAANVQSSAAKEEGAENVQQTAVPGPSGDAATEEQASGSEEGKTAG